jgi:hypothetical protein
MQDEFVTSLVLGDAERASTQYQLLSAAFGNALKWLFKAESVPGVKACLAQKIISIAASGETDPVSIGKIAIAETRECLANAGAAAMANPSPAQTAPVALSEF